MPFPNSGCYRGVLLHTLCQGLIISWTIRTSQIYSNFTCTSNKRLLACHMTEENFKISFHKPTRFIPVLGFAIGTYYSTNNIRDTCRSHHSWRASVYQSLFTWFSDIKIKLRRTSGVLNYSAEESTRISAESQVIQNANWPCQNIVLLDILFIEKLWMHNGLITSQQQDLLITQNENSDLPVLIFRNNCLLHTFHTQILFNWHNINWFD